MSDDLISREKLLEQTAEWEAAALDHVEKLDPEEDREEWVRWSAILQERTAFEHDVQDAPAAEPTSGRWDDKSIAFFRKCSECGCCIKWAGKPFLDDGMHYKYCPECGAKMENSNGFNQQGNGLEST